MTSTRELAEARRNVERTKRRLSSTLGALQYRLKPGTLATNAWEGIKDRGGAAAEDALQAVKERPAAASGVAAALALILARRPLGAAIGRLFRGKPDGDDLVTTRIDNPDTHYDLATPLVQRSLTEGVKA